MKTEYRLQPVKKKTLTDMVAEQLIGLIQKDMKDGEKLPSERDLMELLEVGRSSIREALRALEMIGLVETRTGDGTFVTKDTKLLFRKPMEWGIFDNEKSIMDLIEARKIFETALVDTVVDRITDEELGMMEAAVIQMEKIQPPNQELFLHADLRFHEIFVRATRNEVLIETMNLSMRTLEKERTFSIAKSTNYKKIADYHREVFEFLKARNKEKTRDAMMAHMSNTERLFKVHMEGQRKGG
jgi:GntR family transcriptional repressor for pyruvate dehydrogenase complex